MQDSDQGLPGFEGALDGSELTIAVVQAIFLVIVLDAFFAVFFSEVGWI